MTKPVMPLVVGLAVPKGTDKSRYEYGDGQYWEGDAYPGGGTGNGHTACHEGPYMYRVNAKAFWDQPFILRGR